MINYDEYCCHFPNKLKRELEQDPTRWILSLPMFEYIHEVAYETYVRYGGDSDAYNTFFNEVISPILEEYHKKLHAYRFEMRILRVKYVSVIERRRMKSELNNEMFTTVVKTRERIRHLYHDFVNEQVLNNSPHISGTNVNGQMNGTFETIPV